MYLVDIPLITPQFEQNALNIFRDRFGSHTIKYYAIRTLIKFYQLISNRSLLYTHLKSRGINTCFWVLQSDDEFTRAFKLGAAGVMTDYPTRLQQYLKRNNNTVAQNIH